MIKKWKMWAVAVASVVLLGGCGSQSKGTVTEPKNSSTAEVTQPQPTPTTKPEPSPSPEPQWDDTMEQQLYNSYIEVNNFIMGRLDSSINRYFTYVDYQEEFKLLDDDYYCLSIGEYQVKEFDTVNLLAESKPEKAPVDEAFLTMYPSLRELMLVLDEVYEYTDEDGYLEDDYTKGKELHATLWKAFDDFAATGGTFIEELDLVAEEHKAESLEEMKNEGYVLLYTLNMLLDTAQKIQQEFYEEELTDDTIHQMNLEVIRPMYEEYLSYMATVQEYEDNREKQLAEGFPADSLSFWMQFPRNMEGVETSLRKLIKAAETQKPLSSSDKLLTNMIGNANIGSFEEGISGMIDAYNSIIKY